MYFMAKTYITISVDTYVVEAYRSKYKGSVSRRVEQFMRTDVGMDEDEINLSKIQNELDKLEQKKQIDAAHQVALEQKLKLLKQQEQEKESQKPKYTDEELQIFRKISKLGIKKQVDLEKKAQDLGKTVTDLYKEEYESGEDQ